MVCIADLYHFNEHFPFLSVSCLWPWSQHWLWWHTPDYDQQGNHFPPGQLSVICWGMWSWLCIGIIRLWFCVSVCPVFLFFVYLDSVSWSIQAFVRPDFLVCCCDLECHAKTLVHLLTSVSRSQWRFLQWKYIVFGWQF